MKRGDQGGEFFFLHVLEFINENPQGRLRLPCGGSSGLEQCLQVMLEIAVVCQAGFRIKVDPDLYQHMDPALVGNDMRLLVSEMAGRASIELKGKELGFDLSADKELVTRVTDKVKDLEAKGYTFEAADASFELLLRRVTGALTPEEEPFRSRHYRVSVGGGDDEEQVSADGPAEAILAVEVHGRRKLGAGEGNGPVDALDHAFRNAVNGTWPQLDRVHLADYKVRILEASHGTDAVTRVLVTATDGTEKWDTVGVHANVVEASWMALSDAYTHAILQLPNGT